MFCQNKTEGRGSGTLNSALSVQVTRMEAEQVIESLAKCDSQMSPFQPPSNTHSQSPNPHLPQSESIATNYDVLRCKRAVSIVCVIVCV